MQLDYSVYVQSQHRRTHASAGKLNKGLRAFASPASERRSQVVLYLGSRNLTLQVVRRVCSVQQFDVDTPPWRKPRTEGHTLPLILSLTRRHQTCDFVNMQLLRLQSSEGKFAMSREIELYAGPSAGAEVARLRKWHVWCLLAPYK